MLNPIHSLSHLVECCSIATGRRSCVVITASFLSPSSVTFKALYRWFKALCHWFPATDTLSFFCLDSYQRCLRNIRSFTVAVKLVSRLWFRAHLFISLPACLLVNWLVDMLCGFSSTTINFWCVSVQKECLSVSDSQWLFFFVTVCCHCCSSSCSN